MNLNKAQLIGRLGKDAEIKEFSNGNKILTCSVVTSVSWKDKAGEWQEKATWHNVKMFGDYAEKKAATLKKGMLVYVEGSIDVSEKDGKYYTSIVATTINSLEKKEAAKVESSQAVSESVVSSDNISDDLPF